MILTNIDKIILGMDYFTRYGAAATIGEMIRVHGTGEEMRAKPANCSSPI